MKYRDQKIGVINIHSNKSNFLGDDSGNLNLSYKGILENLLFKKFF